MPQHENDRYGEHRQILEDRLCDLQLELRRVEQVAETVQRLLDSHVVQFALLQRRYDELNTICASQTDELRAAHSGVDALAAERERLLKVVTTLTEELSSVRTSWSWRMTQPMRAVLRLLRGY